MHNQFTFVSLSVLKLRRFSRVYSNIINKYYSYFFAEGKKLSNTMSDFHYINSFTIMRIIQF